MFKTERTSILMSRLNRIFTDFSQMNELNRTFDFFFKFSLNVSSNSFLLIKDSNADKKIENIETKQGILTEGEGSIELTSLY